MDLICRCTTALKRSIAAILCVVAVGCAASEEQEAMQSIYVGMSRAQVLSYLGQPDDVWLEGTGVAMQYDISTTNTGKTLQCMGAGFNGQFLPGCNSEDYEVPFVIYLKDDKVTGYQRLQKGLKPQTQVYPAAAPPPRAQDPLSPEPASPEPSFDNFACTDAIRRYKLGVINVNQMERACQ